VAGASSGVHLNLVRNLNHLPQARSRRPRRIHINSNV
jgi:hypothetical protein